MNIELNEENAAKLASVCRRLGIAGKEAQFLNAMIAPDLDDIERPRDQTVLTVVERIEFPNERVARRAAIEALRISTDNGRCASCNENSRIEARRQPV